MDGKEISRLVLPAGMLDYFNITSSEFKDDSFFIYLEE